MFKYLLISFVLLCQSLHVYAQQGIRGIVKDVKQEPVGFVTIYCKEQNKSTNSNADGTYELKLPAGTHKIHFQSVGYKTTIIEVTISNGYIQVPIVMEEVAYQL